MPAGPLFHSFAFVKLCPIHRSLIATCGLRSLVVRLLESRRIDGHGFNVNVAGGSDEDPLIAKDAMNGAQPRGPRRPMNGPPAPDSNDRSEVPRIYAPAERTLRSCADLVLPEDL